MSEPLDPEDLAVAMEILGDWHREGGTLVRVVPVSGRQRERLEAAVRAAADEIDHHPWISEEPGGARFTLHTREAMGVTEEDLELAARIDDIVDETAEQRPR